MTALNPRATIGDNPNEIHPGQHLVLPGHTQPAPAPAHRTYRVVAGDTLSKIAATYYGDAARYEEIYAANRRVIGNDPNKIKAGQVLIIP